jgi:hypothetical protein
MPAVVITDALGRGEFGGADGQQPPKGIKIARRSIGITDALASRPADKQETRTPHISRTLRSGGMMGGYRRYRVLRGLGRARNRLALSDIGSSQANHWGTQTAFPGFRSERTVSGTFGSTSLALSDSSAAEPVVHLPHDFVSSRRPVVCASGAASSSLRRTPSGDAKLSVA